MNKKTVFIVAILIFLSTSLLRGQTVEKLKFEAYTQNDYTKWIKAINLIEKKYDLSKAEDVEELIHCYYALASARIAKKRKDEAADAINKGEKLVDALLKKEPNNALALAYKADFLGYEIAMNKMKAISLGKNYTNYINKAYQLAPNDTQVLFDKANSLYYTPKMFGGSKKEALVYIQKAINILEKQKRTQNNWVYLQLLVLEGHSYELLGKDVSAEKSYLKILKIAPDFSLVKNDLYPKLKKRMNGDTNEKAKETDYSLK